MIIIIMLRRDTFQDSLMTRKIKTPESSYLKYAQLFKIVHFFNVLTPSVGHQKYYKLTSPRHNIVLHRPSYFKATPFANLRSNIEHLLTSGSSDHLKQQREMRGRNSVCFHTSENC